MAGRRSLENRPEGRGETAVPLLRHIRTLRRIGCFSVRPAILVECTDEIGRDGVRAASFNMSSFDDVNRVAVFE
jgi:hypothetical protein